MFSKFFFIPYRENMFVDFPQGSTIPSIRGACVQPCAILFIRFAEFKIQPRYLGLIMLFTAFAFTKINIAKNDADAPLFLHSKKVSTP